MSLKNRVAERAAQWVINRELHSLGRMTTLSLDSKARTIQLKLELKGEPVPVEILLRDYRVVEAGGTTFLEFGAVETSREWMNVLLQEHLPQPRFEITRWARLLKLLL